MDPHPIYRDPTDPRGLTSDEREARRQVEGVYGAGCAPHGMSGSVHDRDTLPCPPPMPEGDDT